MKNEWQILMSTTFNFSNKLDFKLVYKYITRPSSCIGTRSKYGSLQKANRPPFFYFILILKIILNLLKSQDILKITTAIYTNENHFIYFLTFSFIILIYLL